MIIQIGTEVDESRILWKRKESDEWERADIDDLIEAYENRQKEPKPGDSISRQALDVIRCKDCKHRQDAGMGDHRWCDIVNGSRALDDYCSYGER